MELGSPFGIMDLGSPFGVLGWVGDLNLGSWIWGLHFGVTFLGSSLPPPPFSPIKVEDILPPVFSVTPKGSGAGYGVGFDLEEFLSQSLDMEGDGKER